MKDIKKITNKVIYKEGIFQDKTAKTMKIVINELISKVNELIDYINKIDNEQPRSN